MASTPRFTTTTYTGTSLLATTIFYGHGLGLFARVDRVGQLLLVLAIWCVQLAASVWWTRRFASDPNIVGKTIQLSGEPYVVIGVINKDFDPTGDVHDNSGIPNHAFAIFATSLGGNAWDAAIRIWYSACVDRRLSGSATFVDFAKLTVAAAKKSGFDGQAADAWKAVEVAV